MKYLILLFAVLVSGVVVAEAPAGGGKGKAGFYSFLKADFVFAGDSTTRANNGVCFSSPIPVSKEDDFNHPVRWQPHYDMFVEKFYDYVKQSPARFAAANPGTAVSRGGYHSTLASANQELQRLIDGYRERGFPFCKIDL